MKHVAKRIFCDMRKKLAEILILSLLAALVLPYGQLQAKAEGTGPHIKMPVWNDEDSQVDILYFEPETVSGNYAAFTKAEGQDYYDYNDEATAEEAADAPVSYDKAARVLTLNNFSYDYSNLFSSLGVDDTTVLESYGTEMKLYIKGTCSLTNNGSSPILCSDDNLAIAGDEDASLTLTTTGRALYEPEAGEEPVVPIALSGEDTMLGTTVSLILQSNKSEGEEGYWDIGMEGTGFADRITGAEYISGIIPSEEADGEEGYLSIYIAPNGRLFEEYDSAYLKVTEDGSLVDTTAEADDYNFIYDAASETITLRNFNFVSKEWGAIGYYATEDGTEDGVPASLKLVLEGNNSIASFEGSALDVAGNLEISGTGSLSVITSDTTATPDPEDASVVNYIPAVYVGGDTFVCEAQLTCEAQNDGDFDMIAEAPVAKIIVRGNGQVKGRLLLAGLVCDGLVPYTTECADISGFDYVGNVYYFVSQDNLTPGTEEYEDALKYPNNIVKNLGKEEWRIIGRYDENGNPIPAASFYQGYYVLKNGGVITNDFYYPVMYLIYDDTETMDAKMVSRDIVYVEDGKTHTFNTDLYGLQVVSGDVTVNGDVTLDLACFEQYGIEYIDQETGEMYYRRDEAGNIIYVGASSAGANVTVNGNVGCLSLHKSYKGNAEVNGNANYIAYYDDVNAEDALPMPETFYGSLVNAGKVIDNGTFTDKVTELQGFRDFGMYENTCYAKTENIRNGEKVMGTTAPVGEDALLVNVGAAGIGDATYPCVRESDSAALNSIISALTDKTSKVTAMDITLIQDDTDVVEPTQTVNLYLDNLSGFSNPALFHIKEDGTIEKLYAFSGSSFDGTITCPTDSFSTYFVAENQVLVTEQEPKPEEPTPEEPTPTNPVPEEPASNTAFEPPVSEDIVLDWNAARIAVNEAVEEAESAAKSGNVNLNYIVRGENKVPTIVLSQMQGKRVTLAFHSGNGVALSVSGQSLGKNSLNGMTSMDLTVNADARNIPESVVSAKRAGSLRCQQISIRESESYPVPVNLHVGVGAENADKYANLYRYNAAKSSLEYCGSFRVTKAGQTMFGLRRGGEYLVTVTAEKPRETAVYSEGQYTVRSGDTLSAIAQKNNLSLAELLRRNPQIVDANRIYPKQKINVN